MQFVTLETDSVVVDKAVDNEIDAALVDWLTDLWIIKYISYFLDCGLKS